MRWQSVSLLRPGAQTVNALFSAIPRDQMVTTIMGYSETFAALLRKHNQGALSAPAFAAAQVARPE